MLQARVWVHRQGTGKEPAQLARLSQEYQTSNFTQLKGKPRASKQGRPTADLILPVQRVTPARSNEEPFSYAAATASDLLRL